MVDARGDHLGLKRSDALSYRYEPSAGCSGLAAGEGHDAVHVLDAGAADLPDREIFARAAAERRIIVTLDLDFGEIVGMAQEARSSAILLRLRMVRQPHLRERLRVAIAQAVEALASGAIILVEDARIRIRRMPPGIESRRGDKG